MHAEQGRSRSPQVQCSAQSCMRKAAAAARVLHTAAHAAERQKYEDAGSMGPATAAGFLAYGTACHQLQAGATRRAVGPPASGRAWQTAPSGGRRRCRQSPAWRPPPPASHLAFPPEGLSGQANCAIRRYQRPGPKRRQPDSLDAIHSGPRAKEHCNALLLSRNLLSSCGSLLPDVWMHRKPSNMSARHQHCFACTTFYMQGGSARL